MVFTSFKFILFFAIVFLVYNTIMKKYQWQWLLIASLLFYMSASPVYVIYLLCSILVTYLAGLSMGKRNAKVQECIKNNKESMSKEEKRLYRKKADNKNKVVLTFAIIGTLGLLIVLKYTVFILDNFSLLVGVFGTDIHMPALQLILPIGLSFYTFQSIGYCVDVYRGMFKEQRNIFKYALFITYFPQILQGPIGSYSKLEPQLYKNHEFEYEQAVRGILRATWGFFKKMVIADNIAILINQVFIDSDSFYGISIVFALVLYAIQIYADFSGFMDIALGCSKILGIELMENFDNPYFSRNVPEFWRRWHISLGAWFKNYIFYPVLRSNGLEKKRKKYKELLKSEKGNNICTAIGLACVWLATGIWHGANWSYVLWGVYYGALIILYTLTHNKKNNKTDSNTENNKECDKKDNPIKVLCQILGTFILVVIGYSIFRPENIQTTINLWINMLSATGIESLKYLLMGKKLIFVIAGLSTIVLFIHDSITYCKANADIIGWIRRQNVMFRWLFYVVVILIIFVCKAGETQAFSYFKF